jgi:outer membrane protein OmpA-like peptidoglycan-associated protein
MRILLTGSLIFLLWAAFASWFYVCKIKPNCGTPEKTAIAADTVAVEPSPPPAPEAPKPETLTLNFDFNKAVVKAPAEADQHCVLFKEWLEKHPDAILCITGHADNIGSDAYNLSLGNKRAENTLMFLAGKGISPEKMKTLSKGEAEPISDNTTDDGRAVNRRAEITLK